MQRVLQNRGLEATQPEDTQVADTYNQQLKQKAKERPAKRNKKTASLQKEADANILPGGIQSSLGLLASAVIAMGFTAGFYHQHANSANLAEYKAYKKGL